MVNHHEKQPFEIICLALFPSIGHDAKKTSETHALKSFTNHAMVTPLVHPCVSQALQRDPWAMRTKYKRMSDSHIVALEAFGDEEVPTIRC